MYLHWPICMYLREMYTTNLTKLALELLECFTSKWWLKPGKLLVKVHIQTNLNSHALPLQGHAVKALCFLCAAGNLTSSQQQNTLYYFAVKYITLHWAAFAGNLVKTVLCYYIWLIYFLELGDINKLKCNSSEKKRWLVLGAQNYAPSLFVWISVHIPVFKQNLSPSSERVRQRRRVKY